MTVFIAHAPKDAPAAEALEKFLERRGLFVERETGERGFRFFQPRDAVVVLWSRETLMAPHRLQIENRALDAWADGQLIFVKLDHHVAPLGMRDLSAVDAAFEPQREIAWSAVAKTAQDLQLGRAREAAAVAPPPVASPAPSQPQQGGQPGGGLDASAPKRLEPSRSRPPSDEEGLGGALAILTAILIGPMPALVLGLHDTPWPFFTAAAISVGVWWVLKRMRMRKAEGGGLTQGAPPAHGAPHAGAAFVSYAHADAKSVLPVVDTIVEGGKSVWIDRQGIQAGENWAGEIVRAIKSAGGVVVMCSAKAFESDHVRREIYLADRYKKPMLPVYLDNAAPPEEFEYFFAGVQGLKLFETPEAERAQVLAKAWPAR